MKKPYNTLSKTKLTHSERETNSAAKYPQTVEERVIHKGPKGYHEKYISKES